MEISVLARLRNQGTNHFEPLHCPDNEDEEDEEIESCAFGAGRTESQLSNGSSTSSSSQMVWHWSLKL